QRRRLQGVQGRPTHLRAGRAPARRETRQGLLPVVQLLGRTRRGLLRFPYRMDQSRRRARGQPAGRPRRRNLGSLPPAEPAGRHLMPELPTFADVQAAAGRLDGVTVRTPLLENARVNSMLGGRLFLKAECLQRTGSFKLRGAYNFLACMSEAQRSKG